VNGTRPRLRMCAPQSARIVTLHRLPAWPTPRASGMARSARRLATACRPDRRACSTTLSASGLAETRAAACASTSTRTTNLAAVETTTACGTVTRCSARPSAITFKARPIALVIPCASGASMCATSGARCATTPARHATLTSNANGPLKRRRAAITAVVTHSLLASVLPTSRRSAKQISSASGTVLHASRRAPSSTSPNQHAMPCLDACGTRTSPNARPRAR